MGEDERAAPPPAPARFTVVFGPTRSFDAKRALALAQGWAAELTYGSEGSWRAEFGLGQDPRAFRAFQTILRLLAPVRGTEIIHKGLPVSAGRALAESRRAREEARYPYAIPPPTDVISLLVADAVEESGLEGEPSARAWPVTPT